MSALSSLNKMLGDMYAKDPEVIDGTDPHDLISAVDLTIAHSPVLQDRAEWPPHHGSIPEPVKPKKDGLRYYLSDARAQTWKWLTPDEHRLMRARFLLWRGWLYRTFDGFPYPDKQCIASWYFEGGMWRPKEGSELSKLMGIV